MGKTAAKVGDRIVGIDNHLIQPPSGSPVNIPHQFSGPIQLDVSLDVLVDGSAAAFAGSRALNSPIHIPQGGTFVSVVSNLGEVVGGSSSVFINGHPAARDGDSSETCNDGIPFQPANVRTLGGTVFIGD